MAELNPLTLGETPEELHELPDGSVEIIEAEVEIEESNFQDNLADKIDQSTLHSMASELVDLVEKDKTSRKKRDEQYEEGLRRTGLGNDAPGGAEFEGASKVVHPVLVEACVDFASRAIKELFPSSGPVKSAIIGEQSKEKIERADRKVRFMNWQLTTHISEYRSELEQLLTQLPMGGSQFLKFWRDPKFRRVRCEFVGVDEILLPYASTNFYTAQRATHRQLITKQEFDERVKSGLYRDVFVGEQSGSYPDQSDTATANDKIEGKEEDGYNEDGLRAVLEIYVWQEFKEDEETGGELAPYIITIDEDTEKTLAVYRNWEEGDPLFNKLDWFTEWKFIPWRGAYGIGLPHIIGGLSGALTGALRALLDSAHINNAASMLKLKGGRVVGQNKEVNVTEITEIEAPPGVDDIRKIAMPMPFNPPSPVLMQLMENLYGLSKSVISSSTEQLAQVGDRTPVGTTMALIEQGSAPYSAIHARLHESQKKTLEILHRLNAQFIDLEVIKQELGEELISQEDFSSTMDVIPVSDPTIFSEAQRFAKTQAIIQMSADQSVPWNKLEVYRRAMRQMRIEDIDRLLPAPPDPITNTVLIENAAFIDGVPIKAKLEQDHWSHIQGHLMWVSNPLQLNNPLIPPEVLGKMLAHIGEHINMFQSSLAMAAAEQMAGAPPELAGLHAMQLTAQQLTPLLTPVLQQIQMVQQTLQQRTPPPPLPPEVQAQVQIAQMEVQRKTQNDQATLQFKQAMEQANQQLEQMKLQVEQANTQFEQQLAQLGVQFEQQYKAQKLQLDLQLDQAKMAQTSENERLKQEVEMLKNEQDNLQKRQTEIGKNTEDNQTNLLIAQMREEAATERAVMIQQMKDMMQGSEEHKQVLPQLQALVEKAQKGNGQDTNALLIKGLTAAIESLNRPKKVVRDGQGNITGVQ